MRRGGIGLEVEAVVDEVVVVVVAVVEAEVVVEAAVGSNVSRSGKSACSSLASSTPTPSSRAHSSTSDVIVVGPFCACISIKSA